MLHTLKNVEDVIRKKMIEYIPISVAYRKKTGTKVWVQTFTSERSPDTLITNRSTKLPQGCEIVEIGVGSKFEEIYKKKYG